MDAIGVWLVLGMAVNHTVNTVDAMVKDWREWKPAGAILLGLLVAFLGGFNVLAGTPGAAGLAPEIGIAFTGVGIAGGAAFVYDALKLLSGQRKS